MLRVQGQDAVVTVKGSIRYAFIKQPREWRDRTIAKPDSKDVQEIAFDDKNGRFAFVRKGEDFQQVTGKKEKPITPLDPAKVKSIVGTAATLSATDFADASVTPEQAALAAGAAI